MKNYNIQGHKVGDLLIAGRSLGTNELFWGIIIHIPDTKRQRPMPNYFSIYWFNIDGEKLRTGYSEHDILFYKKNLQNEQ